MIKQKIGDGERGRGKERGLIFLEGGGECFLGGGGENVFAQSFFAVVIYDAQPE